MFAPVVSSHSFRVLLPYSVATTPHSDFFVRSRPILNDFERVGGAGWTASLIGWGLARGRARKAGRNALPVAADQPQANPA